jgi:hypothetical protein
MMAWQGVLVLFLSGLCAPPGRCGTDAPGEGTMEAKRNEQPPRCSPNACVPLPQARPRIDSLLAGIFET